MAGSVVFVNIHIELDGDQSLRDAHAIGAALRLLGLRGPLEAVASLSVRLARRSGTPAGEPQRSGTNR